MFLKNINVIDTTNIKNNKSVNEFYQMKLNEVYIKDKESKITIDYMDCNNLYFIGNDKELLLKNTYSNKKIEIILSKFKKLKMKCQV